MGPVPFYISAGDIYGYFPGIQLFSILATCSDSQMKAFLSVGPRMALRGLQ